MESLFFEQHKYFSEAESYPIMGGGRYFRLGQSTQNDVEALERALTEEGFALIREDKFLRTRFSTYQKEEDTLLVGYTEEGDLTAVWESGRALPTREESYEAICAPLVTQMSPCYYGVDCGMAYLIRLCDGRFLLIDGTFGEFGEEERLYELMEEQRVLEGKHRIAAWLLTHGHSDHFRGIHRFLHAHGEDVELERLIYNHPLREYCGAYPKSPTYFDPIDEIIAGLPEGGLVIPHTGQRFVFADATLDVLFACEDLYPGPIKNFNDTTTVVQMTQGAHKVLWLGDAQRAASNRITERYAEEDLRSDLVQVGHHGYSGGSKELYLAADPSCLLWPCPDFWFHEVRLWPVNEPLITSERIFATYVGGKEETTLDLSVEDLSTGGVINRTDEGIDHFEDFKNKELRHLRFNCITGGSTRYRPAAIELTEEGCLLKAGDANTVMELRNPWQMATAEGFTLTLRGRMHRRGRVGLFLDYDSPAVFSEAHFRTLALPAEGDFTVTVRASEKEGTVSYSCGGVTIRRPYCPDERHGLYLVLRNTELTLREIEVKGAR